MSDLIKAAVLGIIEGLTEFIPVSSTGHLIIFSDILSFHSANTATFEIVIQLGAILAVMVLYRDFFLHLFHPKNWVGTDARNIVVAILPALIAGFLLHSYIKEFLFSPLTVAIGLLIGGVMMMITQKMTPTTHQTTQTINDITPKQALIVGLFQCLALWPGMSRSGSTIIGALIAKCDYKTSAKFSFIIAVPVMFAAVGYDLLKSANQLTSHDWMLIAIGFSVSFVVAILAIQWFIGFLTRYKLIPFGIYRIILAAIIFLALF